MCIILYFVEVFEFWIIFKCIWVLICLMFVVIVFDVGSE